MVKGKNARGAALGLLADRVYPYPERAPHPVALFGKAMERLEAQIYADNVSSGAIYAAVGLGTAVTAGALTRSPTAATWVSASANQLHGVATEVANALETGNIDGARELMPSLVGRDPNVLNEAGLARAAIESVAENTVDAIVAPAFWAALGGSIGVLSHRSIDTLDSMVGYKTERYRSFGMVSARLDDAMAWIPARMCVGLVALARPLKSVDIFRVIRNDAARHPSPNAGIVEAAFAGALGVQLGGPTDYESHVENRPYLGMGPSPEAKDIRAAVSLSGEITTALIGGLAAWGLARARR